MNEFNLPNTDSVNISNLSDNNSNKPVIVPSDVYTEYEKDIQFKNAINLFETVKINNNFYHGKQWEGVNAPSLQKPVFNFLKPAVKYYSSMIVSDDIGVSIDDSSDTDGGIIVEEVLKNEIDKIFEDNRFSYKMREALKLCAIEGDICFYVYIDNSVETSVNILNSDVPVAGKVAIELVSNSNIHFSNKQEHDIQKQDSVIISYRRLVSDVKKETRENGNNDSIVSDDSAYSYNENLDSNRYVTVFLKLFKHNGTVWAFKCTKDNIVKDVWDLGIKHFPLAYMSWERIKDSYHGSSAFAEEINNQIFVNQMFAMSMNYMKLFAFPKVIYDKTKFPNGFNNRIGEAVAVHGDPNSAIVSAYSFPAMNSQAMELMSVALEKSKEALGVFDAALGNVKPDNTSAIIAVQRASSQPLELQKLDFYQMIEDVVRVIVELISVNYGNRPAKFSKDFPTPDGNVISNSVYEIFDFSLVSEYINRIKVDIGGSSYWSELTQIQTLDNLKNLGIIPDSRTYLEALPDGAIKNKQKILDSITEFEDKQKAMSQANAQAQIPPVSLP